MADREDYRVFVGGLSWDTTDRSLESAFRRFGKVLEAKVMLDRDTGRTRGFGFVTFADERDMEEAIAELHNGELDGRVISVNKAQPKIGGGGGDYGYRGGYSNGGARRGGYGGRGGREDCFKCGQPGHWARECPSGGGGAWNPRDRFAGARGDRYGSGPGYTGRDRGDRDRYSRDRYGESDRSGDGYYKDERSGGYTDRVGRDRYGSGGPTRYEGSYKDRTGPYDRPSGGRPPAYEDRY